MKTTGVNKLDSVHKRHDTHDSSSDNIPHCVVDGDRGVDRKACVASIREWFANHVHCVDVVCGLKSHSVF